MPYCQAMPSVLGRLSLRHVLLLNQSRGTTIRTLSSCLLRSPPPPPPLSLLRESTNSFSFAHFSTTRPRKEKEELPRPSDMGHRRTGAAPGEGKGPVSWVNLAVTGVLLAVLYAAYLYAKNRRETALEMERKREIGKAKIGGQFDLVDHTGTKRTSEDFLGKWIMLYFGFTHCPDICPDEMEKLGKVVDIVTDVMKSTNKDTEIVPLFITVDPERDGVKEVAEYIKEFHPRMVGLTGSPEKVKEACKAYRVYFSAGPQDEENDYIVDHTIIIYLIDPDGAFVDYYGQTKTADAIANTVTMQIAKYENLKRKSFFSFG